MSFLSFLSLTSHTFDLHLGCKQALLEAVQRVDTTLGLGGGGADLEEDLALFHRSAWHETRRYKENQSE